MKGIPIIGGKADGQFYPMRSPRVEIDGEVYMGCTFRDEKGEHFFYQASGLVPVETVKIYLERQKVARGLHA